MSWRFIHFTRSSEMYEEPLSDSSLGRSARHPFDIFDRARSWNHSQAAVLALRPLCKAGGESVIVAVSGPRENRCVEIAVI